MANPNLEVTIRVHQHVLDAVLDVIAAARALQAKRLAVGETETFLLSSGDGDVSYDITAELDALDAACAAAAKAITTPRPCWRLWNWLRRVARTARIA